MCMNTNVYLFETVLFLIDRISACCIHISFVCFQKQPSRPTSGFFFVSFCLYLLYVMISYLYSSIVEKKFHVIFFSMVVVCLLKCHTLLCCFENKCVKEDDSLVQQVYAELILPAMLPSSSSLSACVNIGLPQPLE